MAHCRCRRRRRRRARCGMAFEYQGRQPCGQGSDVAGSQHIRRCRGLLGGIAEAALILWDLVRADPARFVRLLKADPEAKLASLLARDAGKRRAARTPASVMRILRRMKADAALLIALADIGGVWPVARVTAHADRSCRDGAASRRPLSCCATRPGAAGSSPTTKAIPSKAPAISCWRWARWAATSSIFPATSTSWCSSMPERRSSPTASSRTIFTSA